MGKYNGFKGCVYCDEFQSENFFAHVSCWRSNRKFNNIVFKIYSNTPEYIPKEQHFTYLKRKLEKELNDTTRNGTSI